MYYISIRLPGHNRELLRLDADNGPKLFKTKSLSEAKRVKNNYSGDGYNPRIVRREA